MIRRGSPLALSALALLAAACSDAPPTGPSSAAPSALLLGAPTRPAAGRYLVGLEPSTTTLPAAALRAAGGRITTTLPRFNVVVVEGVTNPGALLRPGVAYVEPEFETTVAPFAPALQAASVVGAAAPWYESGVQWGMRAISATAAWTTSAAGEGARLCIVDSGVDDRHQELNDGRVALRANFVALAAEQTPNDLNGHGTHVAGIAAARGAVVSGVAPAATLLSARVLGANNSGSIVGIIQGVQWCVENGAHVLNLSLGGIVYRGTPAYPAIPLTYQAAIDFATGSGAVVVVSAGNDNLRMPNPVQVVVPAQVPGTIVVGATGPVSRMPMAPVPAWDPFDPGQVWQGPDGKAFYSNFGTGVDVFAPGGRGGIPVSFPRLLVNGVFQGGPHDQIWSACASTSARNGAIDVGGVPASVARCTGQTNRYVALAGTSMAAPHVAGLAAVLYAELGGVRSPENRARVMACIRSTTDDIGPAATFGGGRIDVAQALAALRAGSC